MSTSRKVFAGLIAATIALSSTSVVHAQSSLGAFSSSSAVDPETPETPGTDAASRLEQAVEKTYEDAGHVKTAEGERIAEEYAAAAARGEFEYVAGSMGFFVDGGLVHILQIESSLVEHAIRTVQEEIPDNEDEGFPVEYGVAVSEDEDYFYLVQYAWHEGLAGGF